MNFDKLALVASAFSLVGPGPPAGSRPRLLRLVPVRPRLLGRGSS